MSEKIRKNKINTDTLNILDDTLIEDIMIFASDTLYKNYNNNNKVIKFSGTKIISDAINGIIKKKRLRTKIIYGLKEVKKNRVNNLARYKYIYPIQFSKKITSSKNLILEPITEDARRVIIIRKDGGVKIHLSKYKLLESESYIQRIKMIESPTDFMYDAYIMKNGEIILHDMLESNGKSLRKETALFRKAILIRSRIPKSANISFIKFYCTKNKKDLLDRIISWKKKGIDTVLKPAFSKYTNSVNWIQLSFQPLLKLDIGCGKRKPEGYFGIDKKQCEGVDKVHDLEKGIPLKDNKCKIVRANRFMEYHSNPQFMMEEIYRVLKHNGVVFISVLGNTLLPKYKSFWNEFSIYHYTEPYLIKKFQSNCFFKLAKKQRKFFLMKGIKKTYFIWKLRAIKDAD